MYVFLVYSASFFFQVVCKVLCNATSGCSLCLWFDDCSVSLLYDPHGCDLMTAFFRPCMSFAVVIWRLQYFAHIWPLKLWLDDLCFALVWSSTLWFDDSSVSPLYNSRGHDLMTVVLRPCLTLGVVVRWLRCIALVWTWRWWLVDRCFALVGSIPRGWLCVNNQEAIRLSFRLFTLDRVVGFPCHWIPVISDPRTICYSPIVLNLSSNSNPNPNTQESTDTRTYWHGNLWTRWNIELAWGVGVGGGGGHGIQGCEDSITRRNIEATTFLITLTFSEVVLWQS